MPGADCTAATYRINTASIPSSPMEATDVALDIDDDGRGDNAIGMSVCAIVDKFSSAEGLPAKVNERINEPTLSWLIELYSCPNEEGGAQLRQGRDENQDGIWEILVQPGNPAHGGMSSEGIFVSGGLQASVPIAIFVDPLGVAESNVWSLADGFAAELSLDGDVLTGKISMGFAEDYVDQLAPPLASLFTAQLEAGTGSFFFPSDLDVDGDEIVTVAEINSSTFIDGLFRYPDVDVFDGTVALGHDGQEDRISFSLAIAAEKVESQSR